MIPTTYKAVFEVRNDIYTTQANDPNATEWQVEIDLGSLMKGDKGDPGTAATVAVGSVSAISGSTAGATVSNSGNEHAAEFDFSFTLPKGDQGDTGNGISTISKTGTAGNVDTYTITYTNTDTDTFTVTNGTDGNGISKIEKTGTVANVDTYTITYTNTNTDTLTVTNGIDGTNGTNGAAAGFDTPVATVDSNVGTPGVTVTATGPDTNKKFTFAFTNIKGETGDQGPVGRGLEIKGEIVGSWVAPQNPQAGDAYYCTGDGKLHVYDGTSWFTIEMAAGTLDTTASNAQSTNASESLGGSVTLHKIAKTGAYNDLNGKPTIPTVNDAALTVKGAGTAVLSTTANASTASSVDIVAGSNVTVTPDASNHKITIAATDTTYESKSAANGGTAVSLVTTGEKYTWNNKSDFSGNYNDLSNKPTIPAAQIQADWNQTTTNALDYIKNKPTIPTIPSVFSDSADGLVPAASASGDDAKFLRGDGTWATPAGGGSSAPNPVTITGYVPYMDITVSPQYKVNFCTDDMINTYSSGSTRKMDGAVINIDSWTGDETTLVLIDSGTSTGDSTYEIQSSYNSGMTTVYVNGSKISSPATVTVGAGKSVTIKITRLSGTREYYLFDYAV